MKIREAIYLGLTNLGNGIDRAIDKQVAWNRENRETGLLPDEEKLRLLKYDLYRDVRAGKDTQELRKAINLLSNEIDRSRAYEDSLITQVNRVCNLLIVIAVSTVVISFLATGLGCRNQSRFCADTARISDSITKYFTGD